MGEEGRSIIASGGQGFPNRELVVYALYLLGGDEKLVHTEEIAVRCFELFPESFSWVRYPKYPDKDVVRVALTDARKKANGALVEGRAGQKRGLTAKTLRGPAADGWVLTAEGRRWIGEKLPTLELLAGAGQAKAHRQTLLKQLKRVRDHGLFARYLDNPSGFSPDLGTMADLFRCRVDAEPAVWQERLDRVARQADAAGQSDVCDFIAKCHEAYLRQR